MAAANEPMQQLEKTEEELAWEAERNVTIELAKMEDLEEIREFVHINFYTGCPFHKSLKVMSGNGWLDKKYRSIFDECVFIDGLRANAAKPACLVAKSNDTGKIVATRFGMIITKGSHFKDPSILGMSYCSMTSLGNLPTFVPRKVRDAGNCGYLEEKLPMSQESAFKELPDATTIYFCFHLAVGTEARGKGLGLEMIKRGQKLAKKAGCSHTYVTATGMVSQRIFQKLGYKVLHEVKYADYEKDRKGRPFLDDHGEHSVLQVVVLQH